MNSFKYFLLTKIRLSNYFIILLITFGVVTLLVDKVFLDKAALTLFSANSFLYGFYISPIIKTQNDRIDKLHELVRKEATKIYEIALYSKRLSTQAHRKTLQLLQNYIVSLSDGDKYIQGEEEYEKLMSFLGAYDSEDGGKDQYKEIMKAGFSIQQNRAEIDLTLNKKVYRNEWIVMLILFSITIMFISIIEIPNIFVLQLIPPVLCTGLSMLIVILMKKSTLTHKKAKTIWQPMKELSKSNFNQLIK